MDSNISSSGTNANCLITCHQSACEQENILVQRQCVGKMGVLSAKVPLIKRGFSSHHAVWMKGQQCFSGGERQHKVPSTILDSLTKSHKAVLEATSLEGKIFCCCFLLPFSSSYTCDSSCILTSSLIMKHLASKASYLSHEKLLEKLLILAYNKSNTNVFGMKQSKTTTFSY